MRFVEQCEIAPHHCAVTLNHDCREGFIDTGTELPSIDPHIYLSVSWIKDCARSNLEMVDAETHAEALAELEEARSELAMAQQELAETNHFIDSIHVIESKDFRARRKPGPKKQTAAKAA